MGSLLFGGTAQKSENAETFQGDHGYAQYYIPQKSKNYPLILWHGVGQSGKSRESTPDGRKGYQAILPGKGWPVYIIDQPRRGRAGYRAAGGASNGAQPASASYFNEKEVGNAIRASDLKREDLFITTKLWAQDYETEAALRAFDKSMRLPGLDYLDLYPLHKPCGNYCNKGHCFRHKELRKALNEQRSRDLLAGKANERTGGVPASLPDDAPAFMKDYRDCYKTKRGFHYRSVNSNGGWEKIAELPFLTNSLLDHADEIKSAVLAIHGDRAYSLPASKEAYANSKGKINGFS